MVFEACSLSSPSNDYPSQSPPAVSGPPAAPATIQPTTPPIAAVGSVPALPTGTTAPGKAPKAPAIRAASAILIDAVSGEVLYERNADVERPIASTTKVMTALLLTEKVPETTLIKASPYACSIPPSSINLKPGEVIAADDMLHAILMRSANDACVAVAEHIAGSESAFAKMMTERARQLGASRTQFLNSNGLPCEGHYSTARDLATITRSALQNPRISEVVRTKYFRMTRSINKKDLFLKNHSKFLFKFAGADGVKTGWTNKAGHCYIGSATWNGWRLISVVLKSPDYVEETRSLIKYGFAAFQAHVLAKAGEPAGLCPVQSGTASAVPTVLKSPVQIVTHKGDNPACDLRTVFRPVTAPVAAGAEVGAEEALVDGKVLCSAPIVAGASVPVTALAALHAAPGSSGRTLFLASVLAAGWISLRLGMRAAAASRGARPRTNKLPVAAHGDDVIN